MVVYRAPETVKVARLSELGFKGSAAREIETNEKMNTYTNYAPTVLGGGSSLVHSYFTVRNGIVVFTKRSSCRV